MTTANTGMDDLADAIDNRNASAVFAAIERANLAVADFQKALAECLGLTPNECTTVQFIHQRASRGTATRASDIRARLDVTSAATTQIIDHLVASGRVVREIDPTDRRHRVISLTDATHREVSEIVDTPTTEIEAVAESISPTDSQRITDLLAQVTQILDEAMSTRQG